MTEVNSTGAGRREAVRRPPGRVAAFDGGEAGSRAFASLRQYGLALAAALQRADRAAQRPLRLAVRWAVLAGLWRPWANRLTARNPRGYTLVWRWHAARFARGATVDRPLQRYLDKIDLDRGAALAWAKLAASCHPLPENRDHLFWVAGRLRRDSLFDEAFYRARAGLDSLRLDAALHYVLAGEALGFAPSAGFDPSFYARRNPDVARAGLNLLLHYIDAGRYEGRRALPPPALRQHRGPFDPARENVILVLHESSRTGAPIVGWNIARRLAARYNLFVVTLGDGALLPEFEALSAETYGPLGYGERHEVDLEYALQPLLAGRAFRYAIVNSSESRALVGVLARQLVPVIFLLHEFGTYVYPLDTLRAAFDAAAEIVFPIESVARSSEAIYPALRERPVRILLPGVSAVPTVNAVAKLPPEGVIEALTEAQAAGAFTVLGAGSVNFRKGVDLFLAVAAAALRGNPARPMRFIWVGGGYAPDEDMGYSIYLREQLHRSALEGSVTFLDEVSDLEPIYALADAFLLASRLDPLPNVAIDAAHRGIPIVCFRDGSGIADLMLTDPLTAASVVPYLAVETAARVVLDLAADEAARRRVCDATARLARASFDMERYVDQLDALGGAAARRTAQRCADAEALRRDDAFDQDFYLGGEPLLEPREATIGRYLIARRRGDDRPRRAAPGFDERLWPAALPDGTASAADPLAAFVRAGRPAGPWQLPVIRPPDTPVMLDAKSLKAALHVYLADPALAGDLLARLRANALGCDLYVGTDTPAKADELRAALADYRRRPVEVRVSPGALRSLTAEFGPLLAGYDAIGHVHDAAGPADAAWREFQWQALLGGRHAMGDRILAAFAGTPRLGLVFPAEPRLAERDDAQRAQLAASAGRLGLVGPFPEYADYPQGGMLWVRGPVLRQLSGFLAFDGAARSSAGDGDDAARRFLPVAAGMTGLSCAVAHVPGVFR
jgi:glycosyltransferase involved in cell wall biosynthesis